MPADTAAHNRKQQTTTPSPLLLLLLCCCCLLLPVALSLLSLLREWVSLIVALLLCLFWLFLSFCRCFWRRKRRQSWLLCVCHANAESEGIGATTGQNNKKEGKNNNQITQKRAGSESQQYNGGGKRGKEPKAAVDDRRGFNGSKKAEKRRHGQWCKLYFAFLFVFNVFLTSFFLQNAATDAKTASNELKTTATPSSSDNLTSEPLTVS